mmetsp:Transcript_18637/g.39153  ORF Transcript_18637/g.39153 Transcript_18637/m.39153 type:complete len:88 (-) Transcript_18637:69-332(-)
MYSTHRSRRQNQLSMDFCGADGCSKVDDATTSSSPARVISLEYLLPRYPHHPEIREPGSGWNQQRLLRGTRNKWIALKINIPAVLVL